MRKAARESRDDILFREIVSLRRHLRSCRQCMYAKKSGTFGDMCDVSRKLLYVIAYRLDDIVKLRVAARIDDRDYVYACPDIGKHGKSYELTALPLAVTGAQDKLF